MKKQNRTDRLASQAMHIYRIMCAIGSLNDTVQAGVQPRLKAKLRSIHHDLDEIYENLSYHVDRSSTYQPEKKLKKAS